jgi:hypothetical protein
MADIFVSYASPDREKARWLSELIAAQGYSVWWDRTIPPGRIFDEVIQEALNAAKCVVVLWSKASVASNWVKTEAAEAANRGILLPVVIENVVLPIEFKRIQAAGLAGWNGEPNHPELKLLLQAIERLMHGDTRGMGVRPLGDEGSEAGTKSGRTAAISWPRVATHPLRRFVAPIGAALGVVVLAFVAFVLFKENGPDEKTQSISVSEHPTKSSAQPSSGADSRPAATVEQQPISSAEGLQRAPAHAAPGPRINLLAPQNGGQVVVASNHGWIRTIDGNEHSYVYVDNGEGVYAFKDERPAIFDTFAVLIPQTNDYNLKDFELLAGNDSPTGRFESIGKFKTQNVKFFKSPYQEFRFPEVKARYLKVKPLTNHRGDKGGVTVAYQFQLFGTIE